MNMKNRYLFGSTLVMSAVFLTPCQASVSLGSVADFAVLAGSTVTSTGDTVLNGNLGVYPGTAVTGFNPPGIVNGTMFSGGTTAMQAQNDALSAYNTLTVLSGATPIVTDLGGLTLTPGVYSFSSSAQLTGTLTLNAEGNPNAQFIFQIGSTLTTASGAEINLENGAQADAVAWQVGSSATLGTGTEFDGAILADQSITLDTGANLTGQAVALNGAVTLDDNHVSVSSLPEPNSFLSGVMCLTVVGAGRLLIIGRRRFKKT